MENYDDSLIENLVEILNHKIAVNCDTFKKSKNFQQNVFKYNSENNINYENWYLSEEKFCCDLNNKDGVISFANTDYYLKYNYLIISYNTFENIQKVKSFCYQNNIFFDIYKINYLIEQYNKKLKNQNKKNINKKLTKDYGIFL